MDSENYWYFLLKVREQLTFIVDNNLRNHIPLEDIQEQVLLEMYSWYLKSDLFQTDNPIDANNAPVQMTISANPSVK